MAHTSSLPRCYGHNWAPGDEECEDCDMEIDCREITMQRNSPRRTLLRPASVIPRKVAAERNVQLMGSPVDIQAAPRMPGERWWARLLKNFGLGAASRGGIELSLFCEEERMRPVHVSVDDDDDDDDE